MASIVEGIARGVADHLKQYSAYELEEWEPSYFVDTFMGAICTFSIRLQTSTGPRPFGIILLFGDDSCRFRIATTNGSIWGPKHYYYDPDFLTHVVDDLHRDRYLDNIPRRP